MSFVMGAGEAKPLGQTLYVFDYDKWRVDIYTLLDPVLAAT
jgi:hypothetical protein